MAVVEAALSCASWVSCIGDLEGVRGEPPPHVLVQSPSSSPKGGVLRRWWALPAPECVSMFLYAYRILRRRSVDQLPLPDCVRRPRLFNNNNDEACRAHKHHTCSKRRDVARTVLDDISFADGTPNQLVRSEGVPVFSRLNILNGHRLDVTASRLRVNALLHL